MESVAGVYAILAIVAPLAAAALGYWERTNRRMAGVVAAGVSLASSGLLIIHATAGPPRTSLLATDLLSAVPMTLFSLLAVITVLLAPRRDLAGSRLPGLMLILSGTLAAYAAGSLPVFLIGWTLSLVPHVLRWFSAAGSGERSWAPQVILGSSALSLGLGTAVTGFFPASGLGELRGFVLLVLAALLRKGVFPFHSWVARAHEDGTPLAAALLLNGHLGAFLTVRFIIPELGTASQQAVPLLSDLALFTAVYVSLLALVENKPRRILAFLSVSQASFIFAGLENRSATGITGALVHWPVVALTTTALVAVYSAIEARFAGAENPKDLLGLGVRAPRLAGIPGTLGFVAEDLLFHGALEANALLGIALPLATALNAITTFRLFSMLFLGRGERDVPPLPDALPRERWALTASLAALVVTGIRPSLAVGLISPVAGMISEILAR